MREVQVFIKTDMKLETTKQNMFQKGTSVLEWKFGHF